jgi:hypothetical protein
MIPGCNRSEGFPGKQHPFSRKDKLDLHVKKIHSTASSLSVSSAGFTAAVPNVIDTSSNVIDASGIAGINERASNSSLMTAYGFGEPSWLHDNSNSTTFMNVDTPVATGLPTSTNGFIDGQVGIAGFIGITTSTTADDGLTGTNWPSFVGFADNTGFSANGFTGADGFTGMDESTGINGLTSTGGLTGAGWSTFADGFAGVDEFPSVDKITGTTEFAGVDGFTGYWQSRKHHYYN